MCVFRRHLEKICLNQITRRKTTTCTVGEYRGRVISKGSTMSVVKIVLIDSGNLLLLPPWKVPPLEEISH